MLQGIALPCGLAVLFGPMAGPEADATLQAVSGIEDDLAVMTHNLGLHENLCVYGDNAYTETDHVVRATANAISTAMERMLNHYMKPVRVLVENLFAAVAQVTPLVHKRMNLGAGPVGKVYVVCTLLTNIHTLLYGNIVVASVPNGMEVLGSISLEDYLTV